MPILAGREQRFMPWFDQGVQRFGPEALLAVLAGLVFLGFLGSVDLWGKREQRASAEAIDTLDRNHWLVAQIQGRPRLEKPPLPRWSIAALMTLTGRRDEWMVRLPSALSAIGMVGLVYGLGRRIGDRSVGLAAGLALTSMGFFISELRQAGNDGPLAFFTTLALYAAWRRLHGEGATIRDDASGGGARRWNLVFYSALGLGFLTKGPIVVLVVTLTVVPYLVCARRLGCGLRLLADGWGALVMIGLALSWPLPVLVDDPNAVKIWMLEMGQKAGMAGITHRWRAPLAADWPWMTLPWTVIATTAIALPFSRRGQGHRPHVWFPWWWMMGNLLMFCIWSVAKPNYFLPCLPGAAILAGMEWVRLTRSAREPGGEGSVSRRLLQFHWFVLFVGALVIPIVARQRFPDMIAWGVAFAFALALAVVASTWAWRRGGSAAALAPLVSASAFGVLIGYGAVAPGENTHRSHRALAAEIARVVPQDEHTIMFFHELDEGLWFYLRDRALVAVPGSQPEYNDAFSLAEDLRNNRLEWDPGKRVEAQQKILLDWLRRPARGSSYVLIRDIKYDRFARALAGLAEPVYRERGMKRNELVLLRVTAPDRSPATATTPGATIQR